MIRLEKMDDFFAARVDGYDEHMRTNIEGADGFYAYTASLLPQAAGSEVLDLGCGTGLELEEYFALNPSAKITGIDLSESMLDALRAKFPEKDLTLVRDSYFDAPLGENRFDAAVSVESLHHFSAEMKAGLYAKLHAALKEGGVFVLTDYLDSEFYHYDTPLLVEHEMEVLRQAGFKDVRIVEKWGKSTCTVVATV